jgi:hypothetical protein
MIIGKMTLVLPSPMLSCAIAPDLQNTCESLEVCILFYTFSGIFDISSLFHPASTILRFRGYYITRTEEYGEASINNDREAFRIPGLDMRCLATSNCTLRI